MIALTPRRGRLLLTIAMLSFVVFLLISAKSVLFPFIIGTLLVYLLLPTVNFLDERMPRLLRARRLSRPFSILLVYLLVILLLVGFIAIFVPVMRGQIAELGQLSGQYTIKLFALTKGFNQDWLDEWQERYYAVVPQWAREAIDSNIHQITASLTNALQNLVSWAAGALQNAFLGTLKVVTSTLSFVLSIIIVPFWVFYVLNDERKLAEGFYSLVPERYRADAQNIQRIISGVLGSYLRGQLLLCFFVGMMATIGLMILGVNFSILLGTVAGIFEVIPTIGPFLGAIPAVLVALLKSPSLALSTAIMFFAIQQIENLFLVPRVAGSSVKVHPTIVMVVLLVGSEVAGVWGMVAAVPVTAVIRDLYRYLYLRLSEEISPEQALALVCPSRKGLSVEESLDIWRKRLERGGRRTHEWLQRVGHRLSQAWRMATHRAKVESREGHTPAEGD